MPPSQRRNDKKTSNVNHAKRWRKTGVRRPFSPAGEKNLMAGV